jgi:hypothetical protein
MEKHKADSTNFPIVLPLCKQFSSNDAMKMVRASGHAYRPHWRLVASVVSQHIDQVCTSLPGPRLSDTLLMTASILTDCSLLAPHN